ncbi:hypothetical protein [Pseudomonas chlororaphis]|uniref:hypothetical protein n=1 Tax=Pseudomonas chlororaphis TaxID=587753 RepID=UPI0007BBCFE9|nr:hypothetical protein [Pseudomonas chlororaphis]AZC63931.1 hypothetical protein C4K33_3439 [Pseudomonas chlororaphis subsp. piscium]AZC82646.1 hypothetical protein C4K30_3532 [Pseudomonas chlororaphis subsp. piscium]AZC89842.1 hypothetical protein C4K29_3541 [Pseudomonas chlororaphis subsp. piscium]KZO48694.1 hypothetical protein PCL1391_3194 [Pseudomonas chlororaphis subsp. piscium]MBP5069270.1 hypothetical protein [Pseudomonas chlororaphis]
MSNHGLLHKAFLLTGDIGIEAALGQDSRNEKSASIVAGAQELRCITMYLCIATL